MNISPEVIGPGKRSGATERNAALLISIFGRKQGRDEALLRAESAKAYSCHLSAEYWYQVAAAIAACESALS